MCSGWFCQLGHKFGKEPDPKGRRSVTGCALLAARRTREKSGRSWAEEEGCKTVDKHEGKISPRASCTTFKKSVVHVVHNKQVPTPAAPAVLCSLRSADNLHFPMAGKHQVFRLAVAAFIQCIKTQGANSWHFLSASKFQCRAW